MEMQEFKKKPVVVKAWQNTLENRLKGIPEEIKTLSFGITVDNEIHYFIDTLEGQMTASQGDWIIQGVNGELYPCKPDIFAKTYEPCESESNSYQSLVNYSTALLAVKAGQKIARKGWNGKNMFVFLVKGEAVSEAIQERYGSPTEPLVVNDFTMLRGVDGKLSTWVPSSTDQLAEDWQILK